jgi:hypothetical protein
MLRVDFNRLAAKVKEDTKYDSGFQSIIDHPAHKEIVEAGESVIKYILQDMQEDTWHWFLALHLITGEIVIKEEHRGMVQAMIDDWLEWGRERGYIPNKT